VYSYRLHNTHILYISTIVHASPKILLEILGISFMIIETAKKKFSLSGLRISVILNKNNNIM